MSYTLFIKLSEELYVYVYKGLLFEMVGKDAFARAQMLIIVVKHNAANTTDKIFFFILLSSFLKF